MDIKRGTVVFRREHGSARPTADSKVRCLTPVVAHLVASTGLDTVELGLGIQTATRAGYAIS